MPSIKIKSDTLAVLGALRGRYGAGHSYDALLQRLVQREIGGIANAAQAGERLRRIEELTTQNHLILQQILTLLQGGGAGVTRPPTFKVE